MKELSFILQRPKNGHGGPLLDKTGLQNRTNKNYITSKTADKTALESRIIIQKTKKKKRIYIEK